MILRFNFHVVYDDGREFDVTTNARDQRDFEEHFDGSIVDLVPKSLLDRAVTANGDGVVLTGADARVQTNRFMWLAWHALNRTGLEPGSYDTFCDLLVDIQLQDIASAVPTQPVPSTGS